VYTIVENNSKIAQDFLLDKKRKQMFLNLIRFETIIKIDINDMSTNNSVIHPIKGLVELLISTQPVLELVIEAEIKALFAFGVNKRNLEVKTKTENKAKGET
jgi:hypothetical protein